jgi:hypothetical protein
MYDYIITVTSSICPKSFMLICKTISELLQMFLCQAISSKNCEMLGQLFWDSFKKKLQIKESSIAKICFDFKLKYPDILDESYGKWNDQLKVWS